MSKDEFEEHYETLKSELNDYDFEATAIRVKEIAEDDEYLKEKAVIFLYITDVGRDLNNGIRRGEKSVKHNAFKNTLCYSLENIKKCPTYRNLYTTNYYRGSRLNYDGIAEKEIDQTFTLDSFVSSTYCSLTADIFTEGVKIFIESDEGIYIEPYAKNTDEKEVIYNLGTVFNVWNKEEVDGILYVYIEKDS